MDLSELITEVQTRVGETTEYDFFTETEIVNALNEALRRFSNEEKWPWLYTEFEQDTTQDDPDFALPEDVAINRLFGLNIMETGTMNGGQMLERVPPMEGFRLRHAYSGTTGMPLYYYVSHTNLHADDAPPTTYTAKMIPTPDDTYAVTGIYLAVPTVMTGSSDEPLLPTEYQQALPAYAAGLLFMKEMEISQKSGEQFSIYASILANARKEIMQLDADEIVAWGRAKPSGGRARYGYSPGRDSFWGRVTNAGLGQ